MDDIKNNGESEPRAFVFGCVKRLEDFFQSLSGDALPESETFIMTELSSGVSP